MYTPIPLIPEEQQWDTTTSNGPPLPSLLPALSFVLPPWDLGRRMLNNSTTSFYPFTLYFTVIEPWFPTTVTDLVKETSYLHAVKSNEHFSFLILCLQWNMKTREMPPVSTVPKVALAPFCFFQSFVFFFFLAYLILWAYNKCIFVCLVTAWHTAPKLIAFNQTFLISWFLWIRNSEAT